MSDTPNLKPFIDSIAKAHLMEANIAQPGIIRAYNATTRTADIQPVLNRQFLDGTDMILPVIPDVPVVMPGGNGCSISLPLKKGDLVLLVHSQKSMDRWLESTTGDRVHPQDLRRNHLSDAIAIPGLYPFSMSPNNSLADSDKDVIIANNIGTANETSLRLKSNGVAVFSGDVECQNLTAAVEVTAGLLATKLTTHLHNGNLGAPTSPPLP